MPKRFLFVSNEALSGALAWQVKREGHEVRMFIKDPECAEVFDGFFDKSVDLVGDIETADVIVIDDTGFGVMAERLRKQGKLVVGGTSYTDRLEEDRDFGQRELIRLGIPTLKSRSFSRYDEGLQLIKDYPGRYVFKPRVYA